MGKMTMNEDGWINHRAGNPCPIPWAMAGEWEFVGDNGHIFKGITHSAKSVLWDRDGEWRLINRWIPVLNGKMPEQLRGILEDNWIYRERDGSEKIAGGRPDEYSFVPTGTDWDIVAVRLISHLSREDLLHDRVHKEPERMPTARKVRLRMPIPYTVSEVQDPMDWQAKDWHEYENVEKQKIERDISAEDGWFHVFNDQCNEKHLFSGELLECKFTDGTFAKLNYGGGFSPDIVAARRVKPQNKISLGDAMVQCSQSSPMKFSWAKTINGRDIQDIEAYERFRRSPRGKEALAQIGCLPEAERVRPLGQAAIEQKIMDVLSEILK